MILQPDDDVYLIRSSRSRDRGVQHGQVEHVPDIDEDLAFVGLALSRDEGRIDHDGPPSFGQHGRAGQEVNGSLDYFGPVDYDYEPFGAVSGTYAVAVSLIFLEEISLNGGSITIL